MRRFLFLILMLSALSGMAQSTLDRPDMQDNITANVYTNGTRQVTAAMVQGMLLNMSQSYINRLTDLGLLSTGILKSTTGTGNLTIAVAGIDYQSPLPSQTGNAGKFLTTNGTTLSWGVSGGGGISIPSEEIAFGDSTGTGLTSNSAFQFQSGHNFIFDGVFRVDHTSRIFQVGDLDGGATGLRLDINNSVFRNNTIVLGDWGNVSNGTFLSIDNDSIMYRLNKLSGSGDRMVIAKSNGRLDVQSIPNGLPAGSDHWIQYNNSGAFGASNQFQWIESSHWLLVADNDNRTLEINPQVGSYGIGDIDNESNGTAILVRDSTNRIELTTPGLQIGVLKYIFPSSHTTNGFLKDDGSGNLTWATGAGSGTVTSFSSGNLSPLFTTSVATSTSTPALSFSLSNAASHTFFGNFTGSSGAPSYSSPSLASADFANQGTTTTLLHGNAAGNPSWGQIVNADITNATIVASTKLSATGTPSSSTFLRGDDTWASATTSPGGNTDNIQFKRNGFAGTDSLQWLPPGSAILLVKGSVKLQDVHSGGNASSTYEVKASDSSGHAHSWILPKNQGAPGQVLTTGSDSIHLRWTTATSGTITSVSGTSPIASSGGTTPAISIANAAADGSTKGAASFTAADFDASSGNISIDYTNGQASDASHKGFLPSADWTTFNNKGSVSSVATGYGLSGGTITTAGTIKVDSSKILTRFHGDSTYALKSSNINTTSPITGGGNLSADRTIAINDAAADGSTKGAATFTAADFNSSSGNISIDYTNGQAASASNKGFLPAADWTTFNNKSNLGYALIYTTANMNPVQNTVQFIGTITQLNGTNADRNRVYIPAGGHVTAIYLFWENGGTLGTTETSTISFRLNNTTDTQISTGVNNSTLTQAINNTSLNIAVSAGDYFELKWATPVTWATAPTNVRLAITVYISN